MTRAGIDLVVVGAGLAGITAARKATANAVRCVVLDKGSRPGGRMATRPVGGELADHGAQFIELRSDIARDELKTWVHGGHSRPWSISFPGEEAGYSVAKHMVPGGMNRLPTLLAEGLDVRVKSEVVGIRWEKPNWEVDLRNAASLQSAALLLTCPVPQALRLLTTANIPFDSHALATLERVQYHPCFTLLARLERKSAVPCPGGIFLDVEPIAWIADNLQKGLSLGATTLSIQATSLFSTRHLEDSPDRITSILAEAAAPYLGSRIVSSHLHRWRYARPKTPLRQRHVLLSSHPTIMLAGDAFGGDDIEAALLSGLEAGGELAAILKSHSHPADHD